MYFRSLKPAAAAVAAVAAIAPKDLKIDDPSKHYYDPPTLTVDTAS